MTEITVLVIDDHPLFRRGVVTALLLSPGIRVVGEASQGEQGLALIRQLLPNVAVVDVNLPGINGHQVTWQVTTERLPVHIILMTAFDDGEQRINARYAGASAFCSKDIEAEELIDLVCQVAESPLRVGISTGHPFWSAGKTGEMPEEDRTIRPLSAREMDVLTCVAQGYSNKEIAASLDISHQTVKNHVTAILRKLGVADRTQAALYALRHGWVHLYQQDYIAQE